MRTRHLASLASLTLLGAMVAQPVLYAAEAPPIGAGYTNVIAIPVDDPSVTEIAGALFKPAGKGPFPAVVYMIGCNGLDFPPEAKQEKRVIDGLTSKGVAVLI